MYWLLLFTWVLGTLFALPEFLLVPRPQHADLSVEQCRACGHAVGSSPVWFQRLVWKSTATAKKSSYVISMPHESTWCDANCTYGGTWKARASSPMPESSTWKHCQRGMSPWFQMTAEVRFLFQRGSCWLPCWLFEHPRRMGVRADENMSMSRVVFYGIFRKP